MAGEGHLGLRIPRDVRRERARGTLLNVMKQQVVRRRLPAPPKAGYEQLEWQLGLVQSLGAQGIIFDQMGGIPPYICFSKDHPHAKPSLAVGPAKVRNMKRLREVMKARDPNFAFVIELGTDCYAGLADIVHSHGIGFWPEPEAFGETLRYTFPEPLITNRGGGPAHEAHADPATPSRSAGGSISNLRDARDPELGPFLSRLCELRNKNPEVLLDGRFVDSEGFLSDSSLVSAHAFVAGDRMAVTLWNPGARPPGASTSSRPATIWRRSSGRTGDGRDSLARFSSKEVAVMIFRRTQ